MHRIIICLYCCCTASTDPNMNYGRSDEKHDGKANLMDWGEKPGKLAERHRVAGLGLGSCKFTVVGMSMVCNRSITAINTGLTSLTQLECATLSKAGRAKGGHVKALTSQLPSLGHKD